MTIEETLTQELATVRRRAAALEAALQALQGAPTSPRARAVATGTSNTMREADRADAWRAAAQRVGEALASVGPDGYYDMTPEQWRDWALSILQPTPDVVR